MSVVLFYKYTPVDRPEQVCGEQQVICAKLGLSGKMRIAEEGINGMLFGSLGRLEEYAELMEAHELFRGIQYKYSRAETDPFDGKFETKLCKEITSTGAMRAAKPTALGGTGGEHANPELFHELVKQAQHDDNIVLIDTRNWYETNVGTFKGAIDPKIRNFAQFPVWLDINRHAIEGKHVVMFCTGGIRCEKASAHVQNLKVASRVTQLEGGIHSYLEKFSPLASESGLYTKRNGEEQHASSPVGDECLFEGINFQFDGRYSDPLAGQGTIGPFQGAKCLECGYSCSLTREEARCSICKDFVLLCDPCFQKFSPTRLANDPVEQDGANSRKPAILCFEHQLLSDEWNNSLKRLNVDQATLERHVVALHKLIENASGRPHRKRRKTLQLQLSRILEFLGRDDNVVIEENKGTPFTPFVPAFEWQKR